MRTPRHKSSQSTFYHLITRVAGDKSFRPLMDPVARKKFLELMDHFTQVYCCLVVSFEIMGTHYHLILWMEQFRRLCREELQRRAALLWGVDAALRKTADWSDEAWDRFNHKLFDLSSFMQHLNGEFAKWYNRSYDRRGHFWGDRFTSTELLGMNALQQCLLYVETNATRAHLTDLPQRLQASSTWRRFQGLDESLMAIEKIFADAPEGQAMAVYRQRLEWRMQYDLEAEEAERQQNRQPFFAQGRVIGPKEEVERHLDECRRQGIFKKRCNAIPQMDGQLYSACKPRS